MTTKDSLIKARKTVNMGLFKLEQLYNGSPDNKTVYFIVEGKDDIPYYAIKGKDKINKEWRIQCINAEGRKNVVDTYNKLDWTVFSKNRIVFFLDRDLSDYTSEETPQSDNVYVTDSYSIENELCTVDTYLNAIKFYYNLEDMEQKEEEILLSIYTDCWRQFESIAIPIMAKILLWKKNSIICNYANFKMQSVFKIQNNSVELISTYHDINDVIDCLSMRSGVSPVEEDLSIYINELQSIHQSNEFIRGKYILAFFVSMIKYTVSNIDTILITRKKVRDSLSLGYEDCTIKLCGIMTIPSSLKVFLENINNKLL